jgi:hypothetical protein
MAKRDTKKEDPEMIFFSFQNYVVLPVNEDLIAFCFVMCFLSRNF